MKRKYSISFIEEEVYKSLGNSQKNIFEKVNDESAEKDEIMEYNWENNQRGNALDTEEMIAKSQQAGILSIFIHF